MKVKVCGLTREQDVELACALGAWAVGFVLAEGSPRKLSLSRAKELRARVPAGVLAVGVFEDALAAELVTAAAECRFDALQLHGAWPAMLDVNVPVYRALGLRLRQPAPAISPRVAGVLVEPQRTVAERRAGKRPSTVQQKWAWQQARLLKTAGLFTILAGGLAPDTVADAVAEGGPDAVDVSGGVESAPGVKDPAKLKAFFAAASLPL